MNEKKADLHVHSVFSDGSMAPFEIIDLAKEKEFFGLSITDHDCFSGFQPLKEYAEKQEIKIIPGIEISSEHEGHPVHVLGYSFRENSHLEAFCKEGKNRREKRFFEMLNKASSLGMKVSFEEIQEAFPYAHVYGRPHLAALFVKKGFVSDQKEAFSKFLKEGKPVYVFGKKWTVQEAINAIHEAGGHAVLAHPHLLKDWFLFNSLLTMPFDGIEAYYAAFSLEKNEYFVKKAESCGKYVTGGSDFHGARRAEIPFGASWTNEKTFSMLLQHYHVHGQ